MHPQTERFLTYLLKGENEHNKVKLRKLKYGKPSKTLDKEEKKYERFVKALEHIKIIRKKRRWSPLSKIRFKPLISP